LVSDGYNRDLNPSAPRLSTCDWLQYILIVPLVDKCKSRGGGELGGEEQEREREREFWRRASGGEEL